MSYVIFLYIILLFHVCSHMHTHSHVHRCSVHCQICSAPIAFIVLCLLFIHVYSYIPYVHTYLTYAQVLSSFPSFSTETRLPLRFHSHYGNMAAPFTGAFSNITTAPPQLNSVQGMRARVLVCLRACVLVCACAWACLCMYDYHIAASMKTLAPSERWMAISYAWQRRSATRVCVCARMCVHAYARMLLFCNVLLLSYLIISFVFQHAGGTPILLSANDSRSLLLSAANNFMVITT